MCKTGAPQPESAETDLVRSLEAGWGGGGKGKG